MSNEKRKKLVALAQQYKFYIIADEAYQLLNFRPSGVVPLFYHDSESDPRVFSVGTFSKLIGPGTKVGWVQAHTSLLKPLQHMLQGAVRREDLQAVLEVILGLNLPLHQAPGPPHWPEEVVATLGNSAVALDGSAVGSNWDSSASLLHAATAGVLARCFDGARLQADGGRGHVAGFSAVLAVGLSRGLGLVAGLLRGVGALRIICALSRVLGGVLGGGGGGESKECERYLHDD